MLPFALQKRKRLSYPLSDGIVLMTATVKICGWEQRS
jgi:hypothetical protein